MTTDRQSPTTTEDRTVEVMGTRRGRLLTSVFIVVTLLAIGASVMPDSVIKNEALAVARPYLNTVGLDQTWGVFSPDPRRQTSSVLTVIDRADGTRVVRPHPHAVGPAEYSDYRWRALLSQLAVPGRDEDRQVYARWVADQDRADGHEPVRVSLVRRSAVLAQPGPGPDQGPWTETLVSSMEVGR